MASETTTQFASAERASAEKLRRQIQLFAQHIMETSLLDAVPDVLVVLNSNRQIVYANESIHNLIGTNDIQIVYGQRPGEVVNCVHAFKNAGGCGTTEFCSECGASQAILTGLGGKADVQECRITMVNGEALDLRVWTKPLQLADEHFVMFALHDISHEKRREVLERTFFHDVLNSAGFIVSLLEWVTIQDEQGDTADLNSFRGDLESAAHRVVDEIQTHRLILAAEAKDLSPQVSKIEVGSYLHYTLQAVNHTASNRNIKLVIAIGEPAVMYSDPTLLGRVLINMVKNACEASLVGGTVTVSYEVKDSHITFKVHNETAMPREVQLQIFNRSFTTKGNGRGIGTYSMKLFTEQYLNGQIGFKTAQEDGTTFYVMFPLKLNMVSS